jgi:Putative phage abortive infection protein
MENFMTKPDEDAGTKAVNWKPLIILAITVTLVWILSGGAIHWLFGTTDRGTFGDMFGAVNALFSGLAFSGLIFAIFLQREELKLQREELKLQRIETAATREEIKGQKEQAIAQNATLSQQTFENTLFQLLGHHVEITNEMKTSAMGISHSGRACFAFHFEQMVSNYNNVSSNSSVERRDVLKTAAENLAPSMEQSVGHYLRSLYNILEFIDTSQVGQKQRYASFISDQLSSSELSVIMYCCMFADRYRDLKTLIERYSVLRNITSYDLLEKEEYLSRYSSSAFAKEI